MPLSTPALAISPANTAEPMEAAASGYSAAPSSVPSGLGGAAKRGSSSLPAAALEVSRAPPGWFQQPSKVLNRATARAVSPELA